MIRVNERIVFHKRCDVDIQYKPLSPHLRVRWGDNIYSVAGSIIPGAVFRRWIELRDVVNRLQEPV